jgi:hypothetical protein
MPAQRAQGYREPPIVFNRRKLYASFAYRNTIAPSIFSDRRVYLLVYVSERTTKGVEMLAIYRIFL